MRARASVIALIFLPTMGCATMAPQQVGQVAGTIAGAAAIPGIGAPIGGLLGLLAGLLVQGRVDQAVEKRERVELKEQMGSPAQAVTERIDESAIGIPTRVWVDEAWRNGRLVAGHFEQRNIP